MKTAHGGQTPVKTLTEHSAADEIARQAGGKGRHLHRLTKAGFPVPRWAVIPGTAFERYLRDNGIDEPVAALLAAATVDNAEATAERISALILNGDLVGQVARCVADAHAYAADAGEPVAVRSSGMEEDGAAHSFAGQFASYLNVEGRDLVRERVKHCWASAFSERSLHYRLHNGLTPRPEGMAVVVQRMVQSQTSGVLFTADPVTGDPGKYVVSAARGLGDALVSGAADADTYVMRAADAELHHAVTADGSSPGVLTPEDLKQLHAIGRRVAAELGSPQDIEWALAEGRLWLLQTRPITVAAGLEGVRIWDNSNIIESFDGIVSPLTYSFAADAYARVYRGYAKALKVPRAQLAQMDEWLPEMLGYFHGRVYYNLLHWYRMVRLAPGYRLNRRVLEVSLGVEEPLSDDFADGIQPYVFGSPVTKKAARARSGAVFVRRFLRMGKSVDEFMEFFYRAYAEFDAVDYDELPADEVYRRFRSLERELIDQWGPMMALDASLLVAVGALHLLTKRWLPGAPDWLTWAAANPGSDLESIEPVHALNELVAVVNADPAARSLIETKPPAELFAALAEAGSTEVLAGVDDYVERFGYRSFDELKLEVTDLREEPANLFVMLRDALTERPAGSATEADGYLDEHLRGPRRFVYEIVRRKARSMLADRERLRFCRTRAFGSAKRMLRAIGRDLARTGVLEHWEDVFQLRLEEIRGLFAGTVSHSELPALVAVRKRTREQDAELLAPSRFVTGGQPYAPAGLAAAGWAPPMDAGGEVSRLRGIPSAPGVVEGRAVVATEPVAVDGGILVAYRTDPGWVPALRSATALIIERGSPLTHVAIVARELGIPTVVQVKDATRHIRSGMLLRLDGGTGAVTVLDAEEVAA
jgi:pyruvate,water dikinase